MTDKRREPGRPVTTGKGTPIVVRCHDEFLSAVDAWREKQNVPPSRPAAIRYLAEVGLGKRRK